MPFAFPDAPVAGQVHSEFGVDYVYDASGVWNLQSGGAMTDYVLKAGDTMTGPLVLTADAAASINLNPGGGQYSGRVEFYDNAGVRRGYLGRLDSLAAAPLNLVLEGGTRGLHISGGGLSWGTDTAVTAATDLSKGICLYGYGGTSKFGFSITSGTLNYLVENAANKHNFIVGTAMKLHINSSGLFQPTVADNANGYFIGDRYHGMYFHGGNKLVFTEYHDHFNWRRQTSGTTGFGGDQRMTLIGGNLDAAGTVSTRAVIDRSLLEEYPDLEPFAAGENPADSEIPQRGVNLGKLLLHALTEIKALKAEVATLKAQPRGRR